MKTPMPAPSYNGSHFPPEMISHGVWLSFRFSLRYRDIKEANERVVLVQTIGADGAQLLQAVYACMTLPWLPELSTIETLRRVWIQQYHAGDQGTPWRSDQDLPPSS